MSGILSVGTRALQANQVALQTAGNNIANVNTPGYSRQKVVQQTVQGQFSGSGYVGKGVLHRKDFWFFAENVVANALVRAAAWRGRHEPRKGAST